MIAYEFATQVEADGRLVIPKPYARHMTAGSAIRVIVLVEEPTLVADQPEELPLDLLTLEELVRQIQNTPPNPHNLTGSNALLAERLLHPITEPDPDFDLATWTRDWERVEAEMKAASLAHEATELREVAQ